MPRAAVTRIGAAATGTVRPKCHLVKPASLGGVPPGVNLDKALALADAVEYQEAKSGCGR